MSEHGSVWLVPAARRRYPELELRLDVDVAVVGAGIVGLTTALLLQRAGARVAVLEAESVASGTTGHTTGKVTSQHGLLYGQLIKRLGMRRASLYAHANEQAIDIIERLATETEADCQFERAPSFVYATTPDRSAAVEEEYLAVSQLGLPASLRTDAELLPEGALTAVRFDRQAHFHPVRYCDALATAFVAAGGTISEGTHAMGLSEHDDHAEVHTARAGVRADQVVIATLLPFADRGGFFAKARPTRAYGIATRLRRDAPAAMSINVGKPVRSCRPWIDGANRRGLIVVGENHPTGEGEAAPHRWGELERWTRDQFEVESFAYRWSSQDYTTPDHVPYVGRSPRASRTFVATGFNKWGLTNGTAAATVLAELVQGRAHPWFELFDATRIGDAHVVKQLITDNVHVGRRFLQDRIGRLATSAAPLDRGDAGIVRVDGKVVGAYRDTGGVLHAVSATCTHLGCTLKWNAAETSWDCPCHGSRFGIDGAVRDGPAVRPLDRIAVSEMPDGEVPDSEETV
jgi:glycine/D-amino acid oxidase-like deaminating enzyme/nitrite reductase/ring-hydroxylating ferredoxin subunit